MDSLGEMNPTKYIYILSFCFIMGLHNILSRIPQHSRITISYIYIYTYDKLKKEKYSENIYYLSIYYQLQSMALQAGALLPSPFSIHREVINTCMLQYSIFIFKFITIFTTTKLHFECKAVNNPLVTRVGI